MALLLRRFSLVSLHPEPLLISGALIFFSTSSNADDSITLKSKSICEQLIHQHGFSPQAALNFSSNNSLLKRPGKVYSLITLLKDSGFTQPQLENTIRKAPILLSINVDNVHTKIKMFLDLGFEPSRTAKMLSDDPWILRRGTEQLLSNISILKGILNSYADVCDVLKLSGGPWCLKSNLENTLLPNIELLKKRGVKSEHIATCLTQFPRFLLHKPEKIQEFIEIADRMGMPQLSWRYLSAIRTLSSMSSENWELKLELLRNLGFSENDILHIFRSVPVVLAVSEKKLRDVLNIMIEVGKIDLSQLVNHPWIFLFSIERRLKPRLEVYQLLERKKSIISKMKVITLCKLTNKKFLEFVSKFEDELGEDFAKIKWLNGS